MDWKKLSPWNWLKQEQEQGSNVPVNYTPGTDFPPRTLLDLHRNIDRIFDDAFRNFGLPGLWDAPSGSTQPSSQQRPSVLQSSEKLLDRSFFKPSLDIAESKEAYTIKVEMAGVKKEDVQVEIDQDNLIIKGEKKLERKDEKENYHCIERSYGSFQRVLALPADADPERMEASFKDGVLTLVIQRQENAQPERRRLSIN
jgi:HSP20 family protein